MREDIVAKYTSHLADLKINSKHLIDLLTIFAEDFIMQAPAIVQVIENHLAVVRPEIKLPVLYLIDSIIKNVKKDYVTLFTQNIVSTFCGVFEKVDVKTRGLLWKLRRTWTDHFPQKKLYAIDLRCHEIDHKWPIQAQSPASGSHHVNPRFLKVDRAGSSKGNALQAIQKNCDTGEEPIKPSELKGCRARQQAVLRRSYHKHTWIGVKDDTQESQNVVTVCNAKSEGNYSDVDLRFEPSFDVVQRTEAYGSGPEPPAKKSKPASHTTFVDLFGHQDVDLRPCTCCWGQVKVKSEVDEGLISQACSNMNMELAVAARDTKVLWFRGPPSHANSVISSTSSACDPLGRPLIYNRLPNDLEERKRSLDSRSTSTNAVEQFRSHHIDRVLRGSGGILSDNHMKMLCLSATEEHDQGSLNADQYVPVTKQILQIGNASDMKEAEQMKMRDNSWQVSDNIPNPWVTANETENNIWSSFGAGSKASVTADFSMRFPGNATPCDTPKTTPWITAPIPAPPTGPNSFEDAIARPPVVDDFVPKVNPKELRLAEQDIGCTIPIDTVVRQIRFYREIAIAMVGMQNDEPRELSFQMDDLPRTILINGKPLELFFGETKKFVLNRVTHTLKLGTPGRELYIDDKKHELFFGGRPKHIFVDGRTHTFQFLPPSPQVTVGSVSRHDLCAGKVTLTVDAIKHVSVFLDENFQKIEIGEEVVVIRFCNGFKAVTLNGRQFSTNFGARLPFSVTLANSEKHFLRFNAVSPETELGMQTFINANYGGEGNDNKNFGGVGGRGVVRGIMRGRDMSRGRGLRDNPVDAWAVGPNPWTQVGGSSSESSSNQNPFDLLNSLFQTPAETNHKRSALDHSYESEQARVEEDTKEPEIEKPIESGGNLDVGDLVANLIKFGLLPPAPAPENKVTEEPVEEKEVEVKEEDKVEDSQDVEEKKEESKEVTEKGKPAIPSLPNFDVSLDDNLKERRNVAIAQISTGDQCSQCGLRFRLDQTLRYSQHLDWHFRQNRREKANARKALSRKWYYDLSDWIQFEEIEDIEERATSLFENEDCENQNDTRSPCETAINPEDFTVLSFAYKDAPECSQCGESFESFFDQEREEWRLKNAKLDEYGAEEKLYHPICHQDYLRSLVEEYVIEEEPETETINTGSNKKTKTMPSAQLYPEKTKMKEIKF